MRSWLLAISVLMGCTPGPHNGDLAQNPDKGSCVDPMDYLQDRLWPELVGTTCLACHNQEGSARHSQFVLQPTSVPGAMEANLQILSTLAQKEQDGSSWLLLKPTNTVPHGGGQMVAPGSAEAELLQEFITLANRPDLCQGEGEDEATDSGLGLTLASPVSTLRKASLVLAGRLPTSMEESRVRAGGEDVLIQVLWEMMSGEAFADRMVLLLNDVFLTDRYLENNLGVFIVDQGRYPSAFWYEQTDPSDKWTYQTLTAEAIAREPLMLAQHILREDRPWSEILTADYMLANTWLKLAYGVHDGPIPAPDDPAAQVWEEIDLPDYPHAGVLTTVAFLNRYPNTDTNRNRHRSWYFYKTFLDTDIMTFADRPVDSTDTPFDNPTLNDPNCNVCHTTMDPVAGLFQNWNTLGAYRPDAAWYDDMLVPGFGGVDLPDAAQDEALPWLAARTVEDPRFDVASVKMVMKLLTGQEPLSQATVTDDPVMQKALAEQDAWIADIAAEFRERNHDLKWVIEQVVLSHWFRAIADDGASEATLERTGAAIMLSPEMLHDKISATLGMPWVNEASRQGYLTEFYGLMYGGIDSNTITERLSEPSGVTESIALSMATDMACRAVPIDLHKSTDDRVLFPYATMADAPILRDGTRDEQTEAAIRRNLQWLFLRLLGEDLPVDDPEIDAAYALLEDAWTTGRLAVNSGDATSILPGPCQLREDWWTGEPLPDDQMVIRDDDFAIRAWMTVVTYLLTDYRFLYE